MKQDMGQTVNNKPMTLPHWKQQPSLKIAVILTALALLTFYAFNGALTCSFVPVDDSGYITANPHVQQGLTRESVIWAFTNTEQANWHPLAWLSHMLDVELFGINPKGHHFTSLLIHIFNTLLCFWLFYRLTGQIGTSVFIALFFGIHPLRVESVVWISERKDVLCAFFGLLSLICYTFYARKKKRTQLLSYSSVSRVGLVVKSNDYYLALSFFTSGFLAF